MRVLHVYRTYFPDTQGGIEEVVRQICLNTRVLGAESRVLTISPDPSPRVVIRDESTVVRARRSFEVASCTFSSQAVPLFREQVRWADLVHYHYPWPFGDVLHFAGTFGRRKPTVLTYHSDIVRQRFLNRLYSPLRRLFLASVDRIVCTSPNYFATSRILPKYRSKVDVVPIGIEESSYPRANEADVAEARGTFGSDFFLFVGVLRYYKGLHILLEAAQNAPFQVIIAGSGPIEHELRTQATELGLTNVRFAGHVPDRTKVALFRLSRAVVFPSYLRSEAFGVTLLEGAMLSRPLISTEIGSGTSHVNIDEETGYVVPPGSPTALREAMDRLYADREAADRLGRQARRRYEQLFTGKLMGERYFAAYRGVLASASEGSVPELPGGASESDSLEASQLRAQLEATSPVQSSRSAG